MVQTGDIGDGRTCARLEAECRHQAQKSAGLQGVQSQDNPIQLPTASLLLTAPHPPDAAYHKNSPQGISLLPDDKRDLPTGGYIRNNNPLGTLTHAVSCQT